MTVSVALSILAFVLWFACIEIGIRVLAIAFVLYVASVARKDASLKLGYMSMLFSACAAALAVWF